MKNFNTLKVIVSGKSNQLEMCAKTTAKAAIARNPSRFSKYFTYAGPERLWLIPDKFT